jgi:hypothetical protein
VRASGTTVQEMETNGVCPAMSGPPHETDGPGRAPAERDRPRLRRIPATAPSTDADRPCRGAGRVLGLSGRAVVPVRSSASPARGSFGPWPVRPLARSVTTPCRSVRPRSVRPSGTRRPSRPGADRGRGRPCGVVGWWSPARPGVAPGPCRRARHARTRRRKPGRAGARGAVSPPVPRTCRAPADEDRAHRPRSRSGPEAAPAHVSGPSRCPDPGSSRLPGPALRYRTEALHEPARSAGCRRT